MNYLAIDTSSSYLTVACSFDGKKTYKYLPDCSLNHSVLLNQTIEDVLNECGKTLSDVDVFACVVGAGSFTGIRIGVSTMKAFSFALNKKVLSVTKFDVLAYNTDRKKTLALIDAKNGNYYVQAFDEKVAGKPSFTDINSIKEQFKDYKIVSDGHIDGLFDGECDFLNGLYSAVEDNLDNATSDRESLVPLYVKKSQAEENANV